MIRIGHPATTVSAVTASRVVPGWSIVIARSYPTNALSSVDFPTLGGPVIATAKRSAKRKPTSAQDKISGLLQRRVAGSFNQRCSPPDGSFENVFNDSSDDVRVDAPEPTGIWLSAWATVIAVVHCDATRRATAANEDSSNIGRVRVPMDFKSDMIRPTAATPPWLWISKRIAALFASMP